MSEAELTPQSDYCPQPTELELLGRATEIYYGPNLVGPGDVSEILMDEFDIVQPAADFAVECLKRIKRNNCQNYTIGLTEAGLGLVPKTAPS